MFSGLKSQTETLAFWGLVTPDFQTGAPHQLYWASRWPAEDLEPSQPPKSHELIPYIQIIRDDELKE